VATIPELFGLGRSDAIPRTEFPKPDFYARDVLTAYNALRTFEGDFDRAQGLLRTIASAWLLSGIGAIGFLVIQQAGYRVDLATGAETAGLAPQTAGILRQLSFLFVCLGICAIWKIDQKVYQKLLHNVFSLGYWIEFKYLCVPPTRMMLYHSSYDITDHLGRFYSRPVFLIWVCALINFIGSVIDPGKIVLNLPDWNIRYFSIDFPPLHALSAWALCAVIFAVHSIYWIKFIIDARGWGQLKDFLPDEADAAKADAKKRKAKGAFLPARQPFVTAPAAVPGSGFARTSPSGAGSKGPPLRPRSWRRR